MTRNAMALENENLRSIVEKLGPARPLFVTISGAHLYGFPSRDSDVDLRGAHVLPLDSVIRGAVTFPSLSTTKRTSTLPETPACRDAGG